MLCTGPEAFSLRPTEACLIWSEKPENRVTLDVFFLEDSLTCRTSLEIEHKKSSLFVYGADTVNFLYTRLT